MATDKRRDELLAMLAANSYFERDLTLASGRRASYYIDAKRTLYLPRGALLAGDLMLDLVRPSGVRQLGGLATGALPITDAIVCAAGRHQVDLRGLFVRKETKAHGLQQLIEGAFHAGDLTAVIDDTITTGGSSLSAAAALREAGANVTHAFALVDRGEGATAAFAAAGLEYAFLFTADEISRRARA
jgi:orotate phosphoribosyltransferase